MPSARVARWMAVTAFRYSGASSEVVASEMTSRSWPKNGISWSRCASLKAMSSARLLTGAAGPRLWK